MLRHKSLFLFKTVRGRQFLSLWASRLFEKSGIKQLFGVNLLAAVILTGIVTPQVNAFLSEKVIAEVKDTQITAQVHTQTTFEMPLVGFQLSQYFSWYHPGIDMTAPLGTPIYTLDSGYVEKVENSFLGYGKQVVINHDHNIKSLYGHMSEIKTFVGKKVDRGELIGKVGSTGWSTGNHLHLEIYENDKSINPLEVLPIKPQEIKYDLVTLNSTSTPSALPTNSLPADQTPKEQTLAPTAN